MNNPVEDTHQEETEICLRLSLQGALLGMITANIRSISVAWDSSCVTLYFIFDGKISEEDREEASCVETEVSVDYMTIDENMPFQTQCLRIDAPNQIICPGVCVYKRKEP